MRFIQIRDLRPSEIWEQLADEREMVIMAQGKPIAILSYVSDANWEETLAAFRRVHAIQAVDELQKQSVEKGLERIAVYHCSRTCPQCRTTPGKEKGQRISRRADRCDARCVLCEIYGHLCRAGRCRDGVYMYSKDFERESDYLAMYMLVNAGISTSKVADIWRRMSEKDGDSAIYSLTHPSYSERYLSLLSVDREIQEKRRAGLPLRPNKDKKNDSFIKLRPNVMKK